jgi:hypothetical protein
LLTFEFADLFLFFAEVLPLLLLTPELVRRCGLRDIIFELAALLRNSTFTGDFLSKNL